MSTSNRKTGASTPASSRNVASPASTRKVSDLPSTRSVASPASTRKVSGSSKAGKVPSAPSSKKLSPDGAPPRSSRGLLSDRSSRALPADRSSASLPPDRESRPFRSSFPDAFNGFRSTTWKVGVPGPREKLELLHRTTVDALLEAARAGSKVGITLYFDDEDQPPEFRSYAKIARDVERAAKALSARGVLSGDRVLLVLPTSFEFIISFFAIQRLGAVPVPSYPPAALERVEMGLERIAHIGNHSGASLCITNKALRSVLGDLALRIRSLRRISAAENLLEKRNDDEVVRRALPKLDQITSLMPCFIQYTSGSTGNPKGVLLSHENICSNIHAMGQALQLTRKDSLASWLPLYHDMGLIGGVLSAFYWRMPLALMPPTAFLMRPVRWLQMIQDNHSTVSPAPNFAYALCNKRVRPSDLKDLDLSSWRLALNGAEPVSTRTVEDFIAKFGPNGFRAESMFPVYGLAESSLAVAFPRPGERYVSQRLDRSALAAGVVEPTDAEEGSTTVTCVGRPVPAHEVLIVDEHGKPVDEDEVGHVVVRGPSVMQAYFSDQDKTRQVIRNGWLWTGDLGFIGEGGLYITGRAKDLIIVRGKNYYAEDIERVAEAVEGLRPGGVVCFAIYDEAQARDAVICVCETKVTDPAARTTLATTVVERVAEETGLSIEEVVIVAPGTIPKTSSGKRQRSLTRERYLDDELAPRTTGKLKLAQVFARSAAGLLTILTRQVRGARRESA